MNVPFALEVTTDKTVTKLEAYNEYGLKLVLSDVSYRDTGEARVWTASLKVGTYGARAFDICGKNKYGDVSDQVRTGEVKVTLI